MSSKALTILAAGWLFICVPFFMVGDAIIDPSGIYSDQKLVWVTATQWIVLIAPLMVLGLGLRSALSKDS